MELPKKKLVKIIRALKSQKNRYSALYYNKVGQIKHMRTRIKKISHSLDFLFKHPLSNDTATQTRKDKRDSKNKIR